MHIFLIAAVSIDGYIAQVTDQVSTAWTSKEDHKFFVQRTKQAGAMVFGSKTFQTFNRLLPGRANIVYTRDPQQFMQSVTLPTVEVTIETSTFEQTDVLYVTKLPPKELVTVLEKVQITELAICGGSSIYSQFMKNGLVQTVYLTVEPVIFGKGVPLFGEPLDAKLVLKKVVNLSDQTLLLEYAAQ